MAPTIFSIQGTNTPLRVDSRLRVGDGRASEVGGVEWAEDSSSVGTIEPFVVPLSDDRRELLSSTSGI
jgi:hypothetical protein